MFQVLPPHSSWFFLVIKKHIAQPMKLKNCFKFIIIIIIIIIISPHLAINT